MLPAMGEEAELNRCHYCGKPFGLVRHSLARLVGRSIQFCSVLCKQHHEEALEQEVRKRKWVKWLYSEP